MTENGMILTGADILGGRGESAPGSGVVIEDGRIRAVVDPSEVPHESGLRLVELPPASTVLPGLIDSHVHLCDWGAPASISATAASLTLHAAAHARLVQRAGVTTVRDMGSAFGIGAAIRDGVARGALLGCKVVPASRIICMTGGHGSKMGLPGTFSRQADGPDDCRKAVREEISAGAEWVKVALDGARSVPGKRVLEFTQAEVDALVDEAHRLGVKIACHTFVPETAEMAIRAGADSLEHGLELSDQNVKEMAENGVALVPTIRLPQHIIDLGDKMLAMGEYGVHAMRHATEALPTHAASFQRAHAAGVTIAAGTDTSSFVGGLDALVADLEYMVDLGMSAGEAIASATSVSAALLDRSGEIGTLTPGARADVLVVKGSPLQDIKALSDVQLVVQDGRVVVASPSVTDALGGAVDPEQLRS